MERPPNEQSDEEDAAKPQGKPSASGGLSGRVRGSGRLADPSPMERPAIRSKRVKSAVPRERWASVVATNEALMALDAWLRREKDPAITTVELEAEAGPILEAAQRAWEADGAAIEAERRNQRPRARSSRRDEARAARRKLDQAEADHAASREYIAEMAGLIEQQLHERRRRDGTLKTQETPQAPD